MCSGAYCLTPLLSQGKKVMMMMMTTMMIVDFSLEGVHQFLARHQLVLAIKVFSEEINILDL